MSWRQVDCKQECRVCMDSDGGKGLLVGLGHINNLYNTTFWALVEKGAMDATKGEMMLKVGPFAYDVRVWSAS